MSDFAVSSDLSFNSLFQKSSDPTLSEEAHLIQTMYNAFRCGIFDNPSEDVKSDWLSVFDSYGNLWRQCSFNGASSTQYFQSVFRDVCRSFHSDNLYEQLLYSLHTADTVDDLTRIQQCLHKLNQETDTLVEEPFDALWMCALCLQNHGLAGEQSAPMKTFTDSIIQTVPLSCLAGELLRRVLLCQFDGLEDLSSHIHTVDDSRLYAHFLLLFQSLAALLQPHPLVSPFSAFPRVSARLAVFHYCLALASTTMSQCVYSYFAFLPESDCLALFAAIISSFYSMLTSTQYVTLLQDEHNTVVGGDTLLQRLHSTMELAMQFDAYSHAFCSWILTFCRKQLQHNENDVTVLRFLLRSLGSLPCFRGVVWSFVSESLDALACDGCCFVSVVRNILEDSCLKALPSEESWKNEECCLQERARILQTTEFYHALEANCLAPLFSLCCQAEETIDVEALRGVWEVVWTGE